MRTHKTGDETWVNHYDPPLKQETSHWKVSGKKPTTKVRQQKSAMKVMATLFFDCKGMIYQTFLLPNLTINNAYYISGLEQLRYHISHKRPAIFGDFILHDDNAQPHSAAATTQFLDDQFIERLPHLPYSPDLAPCDYWLFPLHKNRLRGRKFESREEINTII